MWLPPDLLQTLKHTTMKYISLIAAAFSIIVTTLLCTKDHISGGVAFFIALNAGCAVMNIAIFLHLNNKSK